RIVRSERLQYADTAQFRRLLRPRRQRPRGRRAAEKRDEVAPSYVTCHAPLPQRHAQSKNITSLFDHFALVARGARYLRLVFDVWPISRVASRSRRDERHSIRWMLPGRTTYLPRPRRRRLRCRRPRKGGRHAVPCSGLRRTWPPSCARSCRPPGYAQPQPRRTVCRDDFAASASWLCRSPRRPGRRTQRIEARLLFVAQGIVEFREG